MENFNPAKSVELVLIILAVMWYRLPGPYLAGRMVSGLSSLQKNLRKRVLTRSFVRQVFGGLLGQARKLSPLTTEH